MEKYLVVSITSYFSSLIWMIILFLLLLGSNISLFVLLFLLLIVPDMICATVYTLRGYITEEASLREFLLYFVGFMIPLFNIGLCFIKLIRAQDAEVGTLTTICYSGFVIISSGIALGLVYPNIPWVYFLEAFVYLSRNQIILSILFLINSICFMIFYYAESDEKKFIMGFWSITFLSFSVLMFLEEINLMGLIYVAITAFIFLWFPLVEQIKRIVWSRWESVYDRIEWSENYIMESLKKLNMGQKFMERMVESLKIIVQKQDIAKKWKGLTVEEVETYIEAINKGDRFVKELIIKIFGDMKEKRAIPHLVQILKTGKIEPREYAAWALGEIGDVRAKEPLTQALETEKHEFVLGEIKKAFIKIKKIKS